MDNLFGIHEAAVNVRMKRAELIANNIANAETPGFQAKDLDFKALLQRTLEPESSKAQKNAGLVKTHPLHVQHLFEASSFSDLKYRNPTHAALDGNTVDTHLEKSAYLENAMQFQASMRFLNGRITGLIKAFKGES